VSSVFETISGLSYDVWVVDNASTDGSVESVRKKYPGVHIIENQKNVGFAAANNMAFRQMKGRYAVLLNTDVILTDGALNLLYDFMETNPAAGVACGQLLNPDGSKQNSIANFPSLLSLLTNETLLQILLPKKFPSKRKKYAAPIEVDSCIGACMIVRKKAMEEVGVLDEQYFFFFEETDWAYRMKRAGWKVCFVPAARIVHAQGKTVGKGAASRILFYRSRYAYLKKWYPYSYPLLYSSVFVRLLANSMLSLLGIVFTLGLSINLNDKFTIYTRLILWHLKGCP